MQASLVLQALNSLGLILLGIGIVTVYRGLLERSKLLRSKIDDIKSSHEFVVETLKTRSHELAERFEDEKKFRTLYLDIVSDVEEHKAKIKAWKMDEETIMQSKLDSTTQQVTALKENCRQLANENDLLRHALAQLQNKEEAPKEYTNVDFSQAHLTVRGLA
jgi:exonuclease VII large subunit